MDPLSFPLLISEILIYWFVRSFLGPDWSHQEEDGQANLLGTLQPVPAGVALLRPQTDSV